MRIAILAAALAASAPASAAPQEGLGGRTVYEAAFFAAYSPSSALEVVQRVPGFSIELVSEDVRGFGQAAGNVVINGNRPSSKSDTIETILARIPAARVARVEVGPGDLFGSEFSGKPQVLNLVLTGDGGLSATLDATVRRDFTGKVSPEGSLSGLLRSGRSSFNLAAGVLNNPTPEEGSDVLTALPSGELVEFRRKFNAMNDREVYASGSWEHDDGVYRTAHLNFRVERGRFLLNQDNDVFPAAGPIRDDRLRQHFRRREYEIGGDVTRPLWGGGIKLIGLATRRHRDDSEFSHNRIEGSLTGGFAQDVESQRNETVLRLLWSRNGLDGWNVEIGGEAALNSLDSDVNLFLIDADGGQTRIDLPVDQAKVTEWRGELFANAGRNLSSELRIDLGLIFESSRLKVRGDTRADRSLRFLKPKAVLDWRRAPWHAQLALARTVAQLDFEDFVSAAELANDRVDAGNAELVPQRAWEALFTIERPILGDGLAKVELGYNHISLVQDRVPTPEGFDAPGNLGTGRQAFVRTTLAAPLSRFGIRGGRLDVSATLQDTRVRDPYTHRHRSFSGFHDWEFEASFRQDLGRFGWGFTVTGDPAEPYFRRTETDVPNNEDPYVTAFAEYRPSARTTITFGVDNLLQSRARRFRTFFAPDRSNPDPFLSEVRERSAHITTYVRLKQSFG